MSDSIESGLIHNDSSTSAKIGFKFSYNIAWLDDTNVNGDVIISSPSFHLFTSFNILIAKCNPDVFEFKKCAFFNDVYAFQDSSNSVVLKPKPVHPLSKHSF
jgi:hypothetical protein